MEKKSNFIWARYPEAWQWVKDRTEVFSQVNPEIKLLSDQLNKIAGVQLLDFVDHLIVENTGSQISLLENFGYQSDSESGIWNHKQAILPKVVLSEGCQTCGLVLKVESITQFLMVQGIDLPIQGSPYSRFRRCEISNSGKVGLWIVERRIARGVEPMNEKPGYPALYQKILKKWQTRQRSGADREIIMEQTLRLATQQVEDAGIDLAAYLFSLAEREYWQKKNGAAGIQKKRLDMVGMGWSNHDHHTFRSSRKLFPLLIKFFQILGFQLRERFYAGEEAGWGAQVAENPDIDVVLFLDVDLLPEEKEADFINNNLPFPGKFGTVGLWCALHGDSLLEAGLHHLAVRSDFKRMTEILQDTGIHMMKPFSNFSYLKQAFTHGELWPVKEERIQSLQSEGYIDKNSAQKFLTKGAVGSHLENIQRSEGYKGFSQKEVSTIIKETDPTIYKF